ncbi:autotransporter outer membrane beta-barrel domain-containing protein [Nitratireductor sp. XY-223]|uniref:autotransporter outer membrane beta-barrel domain-containing protein n=1 Tax=Nitratireductor sp. XY-223 TaxID=2561926 RepID=UPI00145B80F2|nr:autotransporter outer membrane beta-barrel domain-containing protein [Nitratireductor sp. XY-223]
MLLLLPDSAYAVSVGDPVLNPVTGALETVVQVQADGSVLTNHNNVIFTRLGIGEIYDVDGVDYAVDSVVKNGAGHIVTLKLKEKGGSATIDQPVLQPFVDDPNGGTAGIIPGDPGGPVSVAIPAGNVNVVHDHRAGPSGSSGRNGYGVGICIGAWKFKTCFTVGRNGNPGDPGHNGPAVVRNITVGNNGNIQSITPGLAGITVISQGGNGGKGGDAYGANISAKHGGAAGLGGPVNLTSSVEISTQGAGGHGIFAQSRGGSGGNGGSGFIFAGSGSGGPASAGGTVTVTNTGKILTIGKGAVGIFAQSIGGGGGSSGNSYGIVGDVGTASVGGHGNTVSVTNAGEIETRGVDAHGIQAQSIGGTGGNAGDAIGVVALGGSTPGAGGGNGGAVFVRNNTGSRILTKNHGSMGIFAQSVGGGGGNGGFAAGFLALGSGGSRGGNGGTVDVRTQAGSSIQTEGISGHGILAQSIGGGGGTGGSAGGLVALGGSGGAASHGGQILVVNRGFIITRNHEAKGIFAQSIGGGGGSASGTGGVMSLGGGGGSGGNGGIVTVDNSGAIETSGIGSDAILAQSIGGGGGSGAASGGLVALGGSGAQGGSGSTVSVANSGTLATSGRRARGILAQSIGGGGGSGGDTGGAVALGGSGGVASSGGNVIVSNSGQIDTSGNVSHGIQLQSIGGGGGDGGSVGGPVSIGGAGGAGGHGGTVTATNSGRISTGGNDSHGIFAQSVGGGGGSGGNSFAVGAFASVGIGGSGGNGGVGGTTTVNLGPRTVVINGVPTQIDPLITTEGDRSNGILAQSVGGGGGNGGFSTSIAAGAFGAVSVGIGGTGGSGGYGGQVQVNGNGAVTTQGVNADGILAQSVGGGGGNGGSVTSIAVAAGKGGAVSASFGVGGSGGAGGAGGRVQIRSGGSVTTNGVMSDGLIAQSIGGGGGNGGYSLSLSGAVSDTAAVGVAVGIGGRGGNGGSAGVVDVHYAGTVTTRQADSTGILLQSVGGSGGNGGFNVSGAVAGAGTAAGAVAAGVGGSGGGGGHGGLVAGVINGSVRTDAARSSGIVAQSVGGGGGNGAFNVSGSLSGSGTGAGAVSVGVGGSGGSGGSGGTVTMNHTGNITTMGTASSAFVSQSIGGGGGNGGFNVSSAVSASTGTGAASVGVGVGGFGGGGGSGGRVIADIAGDIATGGKDANGVLVQSVGGGGGNGAFNVTGGLAASSQGAATVGVGVGGFGGGGGQAGAATLRMTGDITTTKDNAYGALVQSLGGGGGSGGLNVSGTVSMSIGNSGAIGAGVGGFGGSGGSGQTVDGRVDGTVHTSGANAFGVLAQSVGGGGGQGGVNISGTLSLATKFSGTASVGIGGFGGTGGTGGNVDFSRTGNTVTTGVLSDAVTFQSIGGGGGNGAMNISSGIAGTTSGTSAAVNIGVGGFGGTGGGAGNVKGRVTGDVQALGINIPAGVPSEMLTLLRAQGSNGVVAQSVGGGGGNGGVNVSSGLSLGSLTGSGNYALTLGFGGFGGAGGNAGTVDLAVLAERKEVSGIVVAQGIIQSKGFGKSAVLAQSLGGGGGNGAINVSGGVSIDGGITAGIGGSGGNAGIGNTVIASVSGDVSAFGARSRGFVAQSVGGGGGDGAINISGGIQANTASANPSLVFGLGGAGGGGNASGTVTATQSGTVVATGVEAIGILAQSVAGGGGSGGLNVSADVAVGSGYNATIGIGGNGGAGANSKMVTLTSNGAVTVNGARTSNNPFGGTPLGPAGTNFADRANGILVQSIGGGGGSGGVNVAGAISPFGSPLAASVGGSGGAGGNAGAVLVNRGQTSQALLQTIGNNANALTAQSVGGGGGDAGINIVLAASLANPTGSQSLILAVGGSGGASGSASTVTVNQKGEIKTAGNHSVGLLAQSIGGGGGNANFNIGAGFNKDAKAVNLAIGGGAGNGGTGGAVTVDQTGNITTAGLGASAIIAQSIGGGGGNTALSLILNPGTGKSLDVTIGRTGGTGGAGGNVTVTADGVFTTAGDMATAIIAQSLGNGGGRSTATTVAVGAQSGTEKTKKSAAAQLSVGLDGGSGGTGGKVIVTVDGVVSTNGQASHGIHAQSIGGGGGTGGFVTNILFQESASAKVGVGGSGGAGAKSDTVDVTSSADITTNKADSHGILGQSIGGAGGTGGSAVTFAPLVGSASSNGSNSVTVGVGGSGGSGAEAEKVKIVSSGTIETKEGQSAGIVAQSIGGGGGSGGLVINETFVGGQNSNAANLGIGGSGGTGGLSRTVTVENTGNIKTAGKRSYGIQAQSVGGGGGNGSLVVNDTTSKPTAGSAANRLDINIGGSGGTGGSSGNVTVTNTNSARIDTGGENAHGIFAQAIGGGGGNGSAIFTQNIATGQKSILAGISIGGDGGSGSRSGNVLVTNDGAVQTLGDQAHGIFAQSIGGGGGNGGTSIARSVVLAKDINRLSPLVAIGGKGGSGEDAGDVVVNNTGTIRTEGKNSHGILAQSIGGGGGNASLGLAVANGSGNAISTLIANNLSMLVGSSGGGSGGLGGKVTVNHSGDITVTGQGSQAIKAQSINGGGGGLILDLKRATALGPGSLIPIGGGSTSVSSNPALEIIAGGKGTENSAAAAVSVNTTGTFGLTGHHNTGSSIQAIGGGGGTTLTQLVLAQTAGQVPGAIEIVSTLGGENGKNNNGAAITGSHAGGLIALGADTQGVLLQSIGGGGGRSTFTVDMTDGEIGLSALRAGGINGTSEAGGTVTYHIDDDVIVIGEQSVGVLAQSIGGGGGYQTFDTTPPPSSVSAAAALAAPVAAGFAAAALAAPPPVDVVLGSNGGTGNDGSAVNITRLGDTATAGDNSSALVHQSIGAGGGVEQVSAGGAQLNVTLGGQSGANGDGDAVTLNNTGIVSTAGSRSHAIVLQSIGGGGGAVFHDADATQVNMTLSAANSGDGGAVTLVQSGNVATSGRESFGIVLQSLGGGGGFIDGVFTGTAGGSGTGAGVDLTLDGNVETSHETSTAVLAQSAGTSGGNIAIHLKTGRLIAGGAKGIGVDLREGADNTVTNDGVITTMALVDGLAVSGTTGNDTIENNGLVTGDIKLAGGINAFNNRVDAARFNMGKTVDLGLASNRLFNNGIIELADTGKIETVSTTQLGGTFVQTATANIMADFDFVSGDTKVGKIDRIDATGSASLDGTFDLFVVNPNAAAPGTHEVTFFTTQQDMTSQNLVLNAPVSAVAEYDILYPSLKEAKFEYIIDFSPVGLNRNQTTFGDYINNVQLAGGSPKFADLVGTVFKIETLDGLKEAYDSLSPEPYATSLATTTVSAGNFADAMLSCNDRDGKYRFIAEHTCAWARITAVEQNYRGTIENFAYNETSHGFAAGIQGDINEKLYLGMAGSYEQTSFRSGSNATGDGHRPQAGLVLKYINGGTKLAGSLIGGLGSFDTSRVVNVGTVGGIATATQKVAYLSLNVRLAHLYDFGGTYLMPTVDGAATYMHQKGFTETGGGLTNLTIDSSSQVYWWIAPHMEAGGELDLGASVLRAKAKVGLLQHLGEVPAVAANIDGTPAGVPSAIIKAGQDNTLLTLAAGLDWIAGNGVNLQANVSGQFGPNTTNKQGSLKLTVPF